MKLYRVYSRLRRDCYDTVYADNAVEAAERVRDQYAEEGELRIITIHAV